VSAAVADRTGRRLSLRSALTTLGLILAALVVGAALPKATAGLSPKLATILPFALLSMIAVLVLAFARPRVVLVASFALLSVVRSDPAPSDLLFVVLIFASGFASWRRPARIPPVLLGGLACFALVTMLSTLNSVDIGRSIVFEGTTLYLMCLAIWLTGVLRDREVARLSVKAYVITALLSALVGVLAVKTPLPALGLFRFDSQRAEALFKDPNVFGPFLVPAAAICLEELGRPRLLGWSRRRTLVSMLILVAGVLVAFSRAGWMNLAIAFGCIVLIYVWRERGVGVALRTGTAIALCGLAGFGFLYATGSLGFLQQRSHLEGYDAERFSNQSYALNQATTHVFGNGPGQAEVRLPLSTHSLYVRVSYEQGFPGIGLLALLLLGTLAAAGVLVLRDADVFGIGSATLFGSWAGLIANSFFVDTLHWRHLWILAALIWLGAAATNEVREPTAANPQ
jgi:hypothetical protein